MNNMKANLKLLVMYCFKILDYSNLPSLYFHGSLYLLSNFKISIITIKFVFFFITFDSSMYEIFIRLMFPISLHGPPFVLGSYKMLYNSSHLSFSFITENYF